MQVIDMVKEYKDALEDQQILLILYCSIVREEALF